MTLPDINEASEPDFPADDPLRPAPRYPESTIDYCARLPKRRWSHEAKGLILELPRTGMVVVPYEPTGNGYWAVVVISPDRAGTYQPSGHSLSVGPDEIETAIERSVGEPTNLDDRKVENPNSIFKRVADRIEAQRRVEQHA